MSIGTIVKWGSLAAAISGVFYFRGDLQRYIKMKRM